MKQKTKQKSLSIDEQIAGILEDGEHIIWCEQTQAHYFEATNRKLQSRISIAWVVGIVWLLLVLGSSRVFNLQSSSGALLWTLLSTISFGLFAIAFPIYVVYTKLYIRKHHDFVNVITSKRVLLYDKRKRKVMFTVKHEQIHTFKAQAYGDNIGNMMIYRRRDPNAIVTPNSPLQFALRGIDDLSKVVQILQSQIDTETETSQIYSEVKA